MNILLTCHLKESTSDAAVKNDLCTLLDEFRLMKNKFLLMCCSVDGGYLQALWMTITFSTEGCLI